MFLGPHTTGTPDRFRMCSVGIEIPGVKTKLADMDEEGNGEVDHLGILLLTFVSFHSWQLVSKW